MSEKHPHSYALGRLEAIIADTGDPLAISRAIDALRGQGLSTRYLELEREKVLNDIERKQREIETLILKCVSEEVE